MWILVNPEFPTKILAQAEGQGSHSADLGPVFTFSQQGPQTQADENPQRTKLKFPNLHHILSPSSEPSEIQGKQQSL